MQEHCHRHHRAQSINTLAKTARKISAQHTEPIFSVAHRCKRTVLRGGKIAVGDFRTVEHHGRPDCLDLSQPIELLPDQPLVVGHVAD